MHPRGVESVLAPSVLVACMISAVTAAIFAVVAWLNSQPHVVAELRTSMLRLEADRVEWLQRMDSFADAAQHDLDQAGDQRRKAQNVANRNKRTDSERANGPPAPLGADQVLEQTAEFWRGR